MSGACIDVKHRDNSTLRSRLWRRAVWQLGNCLLEAEEGPSIEAVT